MVGIRKKSMIDKCIEDKLINSDRSKIDKLFNDNINLANKMAAKYYSTPYWDKEEALQIAKLGLWRACLIWNPDKGKLSTIAYRAMTIEFINYDTRFQKNQPDIVLNLEDTINDDGLTFEDILCENDSIDENLQDTEDINDLNTKVIEILNNISKKYNIDSGICKLIYLVNIESNQDKQLNFKNINFIPKSTRNLVIEELKSQLSEYKML